MQTSASNVFLSDNDEAEVASVERTPFAVTAAFTWSPTSPTAGQTVQFTDQSTDSPTFWSWNFGDSTGGSGQNPTHSYSAPGSYTVTLIAGNGSGSNSTSDTVEVVEAVSAAFIWSPTSPTVGQTVQFTDQSTGSPTFWSWSFGDSTAGSGQNPTHSYSAPGSYTVTLFAFNGSGSNSTSDTVVVVEAITAAFTWSPNLPAVGQTVQFTDQSTGSPTFWSWSFGDSTAGSGQNPSHSYNAPGSYTVTLLVGNGSEWDSTSAAVVVVEAITAAFTWSPTSPTVGQTVQFTDQSSGSPTFWSWNFGDSTAGSGQKNPTHSYSTPGSYTVTLWAANASGSNTTSGTIVVAAATGITAAFTWSPASPTVGQTVQFTDQSTGSPTFWSWSFGDSTAGSGQKNPTHSYSTPGSYTVTLWAANASGSNTMSRAIVVAAATAVTAEFTWSPASPTAGQTVQFTDQSTGSPTFWSWSFGDSTAGSGQKNPTHSYSASGSYVATLFAANVSGSSTTSRTVVVRPIPPPSVISFEAVPARVLSGAPARLVWSTVDATGVTIGPGIVAAGGPSGSVEVSPSVTTTYTLTVSGPAGTATAQTVAEVFVGPEVVLTAVPRPIVQEAGSGDRGESAYVLTNVGGTETTVTLDRSGEFFDQIPGNFVLSSGESQTVTVFGFAVAPGTYRGSSTPRGDGVPSSLSVVIEMLVTEPPSQGAPNVVAVENRIDLSGSQGTNPVGTALFRNVGTATAKGFGVARVPWIIPDPNLVTIEPCGERCADSSTWARVPFSIDRALRPGGASAFGSVTGAIEFVFRTGTSDNARLTPNGGEDAPPSLVTIVDTSKPPTAPGQIPALNAGETALFVPGVGHVVGSVGLFLSDVTIVNLSNAGTRHEIRMYYTPMGTGSTTSQSSTINGLAATQPLALADVVKNVFESDAQIGSLQFRSNGIAAIGINANILNVSNPKGTFGTTIPVLRSDRSAGAGESFYLVGLRKSATSHTNLFIQETAGRSVTVETRFFDRSGRVLGSRTDIVGPFQLAGAFESTTNPVLPEGAVTAVMTAQAGSTGRFSAYATPLDRASGDFWAVVDWNRQFALAGNDPVLIPVAGRVFGANNTFFRTDVAIVNRGEVTAVGTLRYYPSAGGAPLDRTITLGTNESAILDDVINTVFGLGVGTVGHMVFNPQSGSFGVTSRTFSSEVGNVATYGTGVATLPIASSLRLGETRRIGGIDDASLATIRAAVPGSFRSNFAIVETRGAPVVVRATLHYNFAASSLVASRGTATKDYSLVANQFLLLQGIAGEILGAKRESFGDLTNLQVDFSVIGGGGAAAVFVSSVENGTGDQILRTE